jgi:UDP-N-acetylglucosamine:LPS N-acetylglucosamine transferase
MSGAAPAPPASAPRILAVASAGGHWVQLSRLAPAWDGCAVTYVTTDPGLRAGIEEAAAARGQPRPGFRTVVEASRWQKLRLIRAAAQMGAILLRTRPHAVITTGAAPGFLALRLARAMGIRTVWVDSIANAEELSLSGKMAGRHADLWLTQWPHLARPEGPEYRGAVL